MPVTEATVVAVLLRLLGAVTKIRQETAMFKRTLDALHDTLKSLSPVITDMARLNHQLGRPEEELESLIQKMEDGTRLVNDCSKVHWLNCVSRCRYQAELEALEDWFPKHFIPVMVAQTARDQMELRHELLGKKGESLLSPERVEVDRVPGYALTARNLYIAWGDTPMYWTWTSSSHESFPEVAELVGVCWLEIRGWIKTSLLPSNKRYEAYFVFSESSNGTFGFHDQVVEVSLKVVGDEGNGQRQTGYLVSETPANLGAYDEVARPFLPEAEPVFEVKLRTDGLLEVKLGEFFARDGEDREVEMGVHEIKDLWWKGGLIVQGIEIRTK